MTAIIVTLTVSTWLTTRATPLNSWPALAGVSLRTVRYYVQEELVDRPLARGPGAHFTDLHLRQLKRCKLLQDWGFDLETIRDKAGSFQSILDGFAGDAMYARDGASIRAIFQALGHEPGSTPERRSRPKP